MDFNQLDIRRFLLDSIPTRFTQLSQHEFENLVRYLFEVDGYTLQSRVDSGELSGWIRATKDSNTLLIQAYKKEPGDLVGEADVRKAIQAQKFYGTDQVWMVTTSSFTEEADTLAGEHDIELWDWDALYDALCQLFFNGQSHAEYLETHPKVFSSESVETPLTLKVKWNATEGGSADWYNLELKITNHSDRNVYLHLELPALIDSHRNQIMAENWADGEFVSGMIYAGASVRTNALFSAVRLGDRPSGGRIVLSCHERIEPPATYHLQARLRGEACFVVTYCYSRQSAEYDEMIRFRNEVLERNYAGKGLIAMYYFISPHIVQLASRYKPVDVMVRVLAGITIPFLRKYLNSFSKHTHGKN